MEWKNIGFGVNTEHGFVRMGSVKDLFEKKPKGRDFREMYPKTPYPSMGETVLGASEYEDIPNE